MKNIRLLVGGWIFFAMLLSVEPSIAGIKDTVKIQEVVVTQDVQLNDENRMKYYQSFHSSGIDKINARLGGVSLVSRGAYAKEPLLNSFSGGQINVTIGGMKMFGACTDKMDPITSYIEPVNLKSIQLSQGTSGSKNGSTVGGTFNMELQAPQRSLFTVETGAAYETVSKGKTAFFLLNYGKEKWAYRVSGVYKHYSPYKDGNGDEVPFTQYEKVNLLQSFLFTPAEGQNFTLDWLIDDAFDVGYPALPMDVSRAKGRIYSLKYEPERLGKIRNFQAKAYYNTVYHVMDDSQRDSLYFVEDPHAETTDSVYMKMDMPGWSRTYGLFAEGGLRWLPKNWLSFKVESYRNWQKAEMTMYMNNLSNPGEPPMFAETWPEHARWVSGLYMKNDYAISQKIILAADFRIDFSTSKLLSEQGKRQFNSLGYDGDGNFFKMVKSANLTLDVSPTNDWQLKGGFGLGERLPTLSEQFGFYLFNAHDGYDYLGNPEIDTEKSVRAFANLAFTKASFKLSADASYSRVSDYILGTIEPDYGALNLYASGVKKYENLNYADVVSAQVQLLWNPVNRVELFNLLKYNWGEIYDGTPLPQIQPLRNLFSVSYQWENFQMQLENEYSAAQNRINKDFGETKTPAFFLMHLRLGYKMKVQKTAIQMNGGIENLLDETYSEHLDWGDYNRPGRNVYLSMKLIY